MSSLVLFNRSHTHQSHSNEPNNIAQYQVRRGGTKWREIESFGK